MEEQDALRRAAADTSATRRRVELEVVASQQRVHPRPLSWREWLIECWNGGWLWLIKIGVRERERDGL